MGAARMGSCDVLARIPAIVGRRLTSFTLPIETLTEFRLTYG